MSKKNNNFGISAEIRLVLGIYLNSQNCKVLVCPCQLSLPLFLEKNGCIEEHFKDEEHFRNTHIMIQSMLEVLGNADRRERAQPVSPCSSNRFTPPLSGRPASMAPIPGAAEALAPGYETTPLSGRPEGNGSSSNAEETRLFQGVRRGMGLHLTLRR